MIPFEFATAARVVVGVGTVATAGPATAALGRHALVVTGRSTDRAEAVERILAAAGVTCTRVSIAGEPTIRDITAALAVLRTSGADVVVGVGGGSAIDSAKALAALATNPGDLFDYLEVIGRGQPLTAASLPVVAIPTTAGTGSEVTRNAVIASTEHGVKVSVRHESMYPRVAIVDPSLAVGLPPALSATTGLDALTQLIEPFVSIKANALVDALALEGLRRAARALPRVYRDGTDLDARTDMACAALWSGMALASAGLGAVHGLAGPIGGLFSAPHGAVCAALLPHVMRTNLAALRRGGSPALIAKFDIIARTLTGQAAASGNDGVAWVDDLVRELGVPGLAAYGVTEGDVPSIANAARRASSMKANPVVLSDQELQAIVHEAR